MRKNVTNVKTGGSMSRVAVKRYVESGWSADLFSWSLWCAKTEWETKATANARDVLKTKA